MRLDWKAALGVAVTVFLLWWILRDVPFGEVWANLRTAHWGLLLASVAVATAGFLIRAVRWGVLLRPVRAELPLRSRFAAVTIGFMANNLLPARIGEFARPYALSRMEPVPLSAGLGSLVVERMLDALVLLGLLAAAVLSPSFPASASIREGPVGAALGGLIVFLTALLAVLAALLIWPRHAVRWAERVAVRFPGDVARPVVSAMESFLDGLVVLRSPGLLVEAVLWSVGFWVWHGMSFWLGMLAFGIDAGLMAAFFTEAVVGFGVALPSAPGFFGTFHASAGWALEMYGVAPARSLAFAFGFHLGGFIPVTVIGLWYASRIGLSLRDVGRADERVEEAVERAHPEAARLLGRDVDGAPALAADGQAARGASGDAVVVEAPAKVNLRLRVLGRRPDGYHDLDTLFQAVDLSDRLEVRRGGSGVRVEVEGEDAGPVADNLVARAARAYLEAAGLGEGVRLRLVKRIPAGAGLGGGSSDAAATLLALDRLHGGRVPPERLRELAVGLGSDVPFFLGRSPLAVGRGRGEELEPRTPLPSLPGLVAMPAAHVSTPAAYAALARRRAGAAPPPAPPPAATGSWEEVARAAGNDFEDVVLPEHPAAAEALAALRSTGPLVALLSGSGAASFALYRSEGEAEAAALQLAQRAALRVVPVRTLTAWPGCSPADPAGDGGGRTP